MRRRRFIGRVKLGLLVVLGVAGLLFLKGMMRWKMASQPPDYISMATVVVTESSAVGLPTENMHQWVIDTLNGTYLRERVNQRIQALRPELLPMDVDIAVQGEKELGKLHIFVVSKNAKTPEVYLEGTLDELMIIQAKSSGPGTLVVLTRPTVAIGSDSPEAAGLIQMLFPH